LLVAMRTAAVKNAVVNEGLIVDAIDRDVPSALKADNAAHCGFDYVQNQDRPARWPGTAAIPIRGDIICETTF
jgi:hypothetical protein